MSVTQLAGIWPDRSRAFIAGVIGAAANVGMLFVGILSLVLVSFLSQLRELMIAVGFSPETQSYFLSGDGWRLLMIAGAMPALLVFFIRLFVPESQMWETQRESGGTSFWATRDLFGVLVGATGATAVVVLWTPAFDAVMDKFGTGPLEIAFRAMGTSIGLVVALVGFIYPVARYLRRAETSNQLPVGEARKYIARMLFGASVAGIPLLGTWGSLQWAPKWAIGLAKDLGPDSGMHHAKEFTQISLASGAILGTIAAAIIAGQVGRRITYALLCVASFLSLVYMYQGNAAFNAKMLASVFLSGAATAAFYGWLPLYLPELFPTGIRATCQGFAYNFGRVLSAVGSLQVATLTAYFAQGVPPERVEIDAFPNAGSVLASIYILGVFVIWLGPETKGKQLLS